MELGQLLCTGMHPSGGVDPEAPAPPPGNISYIMSSMCAQTHTRVCWVQVEVRDGKHVGRRADIPQSATTVVDFLRRQL